MNAWLETGEGVQVPLQSVCSIGRSPKNTIVLSDTKVSRRHALIHSQGPGVFQVVDLGSSNGVLVNGQRVKEPVELKDRDKIEVADSQFVFRLADTPAEDQAAEHTAFMSFQQLNKANLWMLVAQIHKDAQSKLSVDQQSQQAGTWLLTCHETIEKHGGVINKYMGDGFLAYWPNRHTEPSAVAAALVDLGKQQSLKAPPFRMAVHYGSVAVDKAAGSTEEVLLGQEVTVVFRMERAAESLSQACLMSEGAAVQLKAILPSKSLGAHPLENVPGSFNLFGIS